MTAEREWAPPHEFEEYRIVEPLGRGSMGEVYLAHDRLLDRLVAIKFVGTSEIDRDWTVRERFFLEARAIARIQHPNVVAIHRVGEVQERPFIVTELLRGESLRARKKPVLWREALDLGIEIARGLAAVHRRGVLHRDIKPANVMVTEDGGVKLLDFGIAKLADVASPPPRQDEGAGGRALDAGGAGLTGSGAILGSPLYLAPELWRGEPASERSDVYAVGVLIVELCTGSAPLEGVPVAEMGRRAQLLDPIPLSHSIPEIDPRFSAAIARCLHRDPSLRFSSGEALREALEELAAAADPPVTLDRVPYRGLLAFEAEDRDLFFGRGPDVRRVLDRLRSDPFVLIAADSGTGKSSLCRAGVLPAIASGALGREPPCPGALIPGRHPLSALAAVIAPLLERGEEELIAELREAPASVGRALRMKYRARGAILFVDQLEEIFTLAEPGEAEIFVQALAAVALDAPGVKLLAAIRNDFLGRLADMPGLEEAVSRGVHFLRPLRPEAVREAVVGPARAMGFAFESEEMIAELVAAASRGEGSLPLLQFTLDELWSLRDPERRILPRAALEALSGVDGCLARHGDRVLAGLRPAEREAARRILLELITPEGTRSRRTREELCRRAPDTGAELLAPAALEALVRGRLVVARDSPDARESAYELAHEALLSRWSTLAEWLERNAAERIAHARLERAAAEWERIHRSDEALLGAGQLEEARHIDARALRRLESEFLSASARRLRRLRMRSTLLRAAVPAGVLLALLPFAKTRYDRGRELAIYQAEARSMQAAARAKAGDADAERARAFSELDASRTDAGEAAWAKAIAFGGEAGELYGLAAQGFVRCLDFDRDDPETRAEIAGVLLERILFFERARPGIRASELRKELAAYDGGGVLRARLEAPAEIILESTPPGARIFLERYRELPGRWISSPPEELGTAPLQARLAPGSVVFRLRAEGRMETRLPAVLGAGERLSISVPLPRAERVPAELVYVPPGRFLFGSRDEEADRRGFLYAQPMHEAETGAYLISRTEVTFGQWIEFLATLPREERARRTPHAAQMLNGVTLEELPKGRWRLVLEPAAQRYVALDGEPIRYSARAKRAAQDWRRFPVSAISFEDAEAYVAWLDRTGRVPGARICDEREWERAARGADGRTYPGGDAPGADDENIDVTYGQVPGGYGPDEVGSHPDSRSPFEIDDAAGNVWEWTHVVGAPREPVLRGGAWYFKQETSRIANREPGVPRTHRDPLIGLRVCAAAPQE